METVIGKICVVRSESAGAFMAETVSFDPVTCVAELKNSRRLWYWDGAASLSELANSGVKKPQNCKFPALLESQVVARVCELIPATDEAIKSVNSVPVWTA